jgi:quercetin dioxygenase-like cupin family protein
MARRGFVERGIPLGAVSNLKCGVRAAEIGATMESSATTRSTLLLPILVLATLIALGAPVDAQDVVKLSPETANVILENAQVRVIESTIPPGTLQARHSHPATIVYYLTASTVRSEGPDGKLIVSERKAGDVAYREPLTHSAENVGTTPARTLVIELKATNKP